MWWMAAAYAGGAILDRMEAHEQAKIQKAQAEAEAASMERQAIIRQMELEDFKEDSMLDRADFGQESLREISDQKASLAAQGIDVSSSLGLKLEYDVREKTRRDLQVMKNNSYKQALGMEMEIEELKRTAMDTRTYGSNRAAATIASGNRRAVGGLLKAGATAASAFGGTGTKAVEKRGPMFDDR